MKIRRLTIALACATTVLAGCSGNTKSGGGSEAVLKLEPATPVGAGEGQLNLIAWPGYAEDGSNDPKVDWGIPSRRRPAARSTSRSATPPTRWCSSCAPPVRRPVGLRRRHAAADLRRGRRPVNTALVPNYTIAPFLKDKAWNSVDGQMYGSARLGRQPADVQHRRRHGRAGHLGRGVPGAPEVKGKVTAYDSPSTSPTRRCTCRRRNPNWASRTRTHRPRNS